MKINALKNIIIAFGVLVTSMLHAQPQWKFHIAFEDATGAKDTIWLIWDTTAHDILPVDTSFGEDKVNFDYSAFNVWIYNANNDSTKTIALSFLGSFGIEVRAFNYQYPITVSWDSSLFHAPGLPPPVGYVNRAVLDNDYFFLANNDPPSHQFNMLWDNHVSAPWFPWGAQDQFPMRFYIMRDPFIGMPENPAKNNFIKTLPNPASNDVIINAEGYINIIRLFNLSGSIIKEYTDINSDYFRFIIKDIPNGMYIIQITDNSKNHYYEKLIKSN